MPLWAQPLDQPIRNLVALFVVWKVLLLLIAACSPGPGYDTSTSLALASHTDHEELPPVLRYIVGKLTRWDGIYFVTAAKRGYLFEQEWAFGWGFTRLVALCTTGLTSLGAHHEGLEGLAAILIAHTAHLFSVVTLFKLTLTVFTRSSIGTAFTAAALHIISPAGLFLSAPYTESSCAFLTFAGCLNFTKSFAHNGKPTAAHDLLIIAAGIMFGAATAFRSNGILNGLLLLEEAFRVLYRLKDGFQIATVRRLAATGLGGIFVGAGFILPQYIAYSEYCEHSKTRSWCGKALPSIYTFVQDHYWNVGPFRYWTISNLPLFLLATPMFAILIISGLWALNFHSGKSSNVEKGRRAVGSAGKNSEAESFLFLRNLGVSQLLLTVLTLTTAHVQIITRISSAYPVWLWYTAVSSQKGNTWMVGSVVQFIVMYAIIQGGLFASFLPPA